MNSENTKMGHIISEPACNAPRMREQADINNDKRPVYTLRARELQLTEYRILLVEDDQSCREAIHDLLRKLGFKVDLASNGKEAVKAALAIDYSLILMDCEMPVMDGFEAVKTIRRGEFRLKRHVPIVAVTADATKQERIQFAEAGMDDFIIKPVDLKKFLETIYYWTMLFQFSTDLKSCQLP